MRRRYFGTPVVEASRLCDHAVGRQVLLTEMAKTLAGSRGDQRFESRGGVELKGLPNPVFVTEAIWQPAADTGLPLPHACRFFTVSPSWAGRLDRDTEAGLEAVSGRRSTDGVHRRRAGRGKTRLATETAMLAHAEGATVLLGTCEGSGRSLSALCGSPASFHRRLCGGSNADPARRAAERAGAAGARAPHRMPGLSRRSPPIPTRSVISSSRRSPGGWRRLHLTVRLSSFSTTSTGPRSPPCSCSSTSCASPARWRSW